MNFFPLDFFNLMKYVVIVEIKGPKSWWIGKSITISRVVNQSKVIPQRLEFITGHMTYITWLILKSYRRQPQMTIQQSLASLHELSTYLLRVRPELSFPQFSCAEFSCDN